MANTNYLYIAQHKNFFCKIPFLPVLPTVLRGTLDGPVQGDHFFRG